MDGLTWTQGDPGTTNMLWAVALGNGQFTAMGGTGGDTATILSFTLHIPREFMQVSALQLIKTEDTTALALFGASQYSNSSRERLLGVEFVDWIG